MSDLTCGPVVHQSNALESSEFDRIQHSSSLTLAEPGGHSDDSFPHDFASGELCHLLGVRKLHGEDLLDGIRRGGGGESGRAARGGGRRSGSWIKGSMELRLSGRGGPSEQQLDGREGIARESRRLELNQRAATSTKMQSSPNSLPLHRNSSPRRAGSRCCPSCASNRC